MGDTDAGPSSSTPNGGVYFEGPFGFVFDIVERRGA